METMGIERKKENAMTKPSCPVYLQESSDVQELLSQHLKGWAFTVYSSDSVWVYHEKNIMYVRELLKKHGFEHIRVAFY